MEKLNVKRLAESIERVLNEEDQKPYRVFLKGDSRPLDVIYGKDEEAVKQELLDRHPDIEIDRIEEVEEDHETVTEDYMAISQFSDGPDASGTVKFIPGFYGYYYETGDKDLDDIKNLPQWTTIRTIEGIRNWFRNVLFAYGAKDVTIGKHHWNINDFKECMVQDLPRGSKITLDTDEVVTVFDKSVNGYFVERDDDSRPFEITPDRIKEINHIEE